jgi:hypothetical protein
MQKGGLVSGAKVTARMAMACSVLMLCSPVLAGDGRSLMSPVRTSVYEKVVRLFWPAADVVWDRGRLLMSVEARHRVVTVTSFSHWRGPRRSWYLAVGGVEFPDEVTAGAERLKRFERVPAGTVPLRIGFMRTDEAGTVLASRAILADIEPAVATPVTLGEGSSHPATDWPLLDVEYGGLYSGDGWIASVDWRARVATGNGRIVWRAPLRSWKKTQGGKVTARSFTVEESTHRMRVTSSASSESFTLDCDEDECVVPASRILAIR